MISHSKTQKHFKSSVWSDPGDIYGRMGLWIMCLLFKSKLLMEFSAPRPTPHDFTAVNSWMRV